MLKRRYLYVILFCLSSAFLWAQIDMPAIFTDHMVLQQQTTAPIWGKAAANRTVKITTSWDKKTYSIKSDSEGKWKAGLQTPVAGGSYNIAISDGKNEKTLSDVLIGEVWLCAGQSNMEMTLRGYRKGNDNEKEISEANYPQIRLMHIDKAMSRDALSNFMKNGSGWKQCTPATVPRFSAVAYYFGKNLHENLNVPIGLISAAVGGTVIEAWTSKEMLSSMPDFEESISHLNSLSDTSAMSSRNLNRPSVLFNAMIHPMLPFAIQGIIWYQGESNCMRAAQYKDLFPLLIADWRNAWGRNFPFYFVQLANFGKKSIEVEAAPWADLREAQLKTLAVENTGMAVSIDIGDADDVHPYNKKEVGVRLAKIARAKTYGEKICFSGPIYQSYRIEGNKIRLFFKHIEGGLQPKETGLLRGFSIASPDRKFYVANAIIEGDEIIVSSVNVAFPLAVRYAWAANPDCNLINIAGLPASPFRTDEW
ncbi:MAG: sialate O-acetylesterase [Paludibacter sp.]|nr:sialate O-acetylesterase [Paludibacter sp.]